MKNAFDGLISSSDRQGRIIELVTRPIEITIKGEKSQRKRVKKSRVKHKIEQSI